MDLLPSFETIVYVSLGILLVIGIVGYYLLQRTKQAFFEKLPIIRDILSTLRDQTIPLYVKGTAVILSIAYFLIPTDFIPDILSIFLGFGYIDDIAIIGIIFKIITNWWRTKRAT